MNSDSAPTTSSTDTGLYFDDAEALAQQYREKRDTIKRKEAALTALSKRLETIDCDIGGANLDIDDDGVITVSISSPRFPDEVKSMLHDFQWPRKFATGYDTMSRCLTWSLKTDIETLIEDHERIQQPQGRAVPQTA
ncbi:hypothetical protein J2751_002711 [Halorubrum alkaliphilum]|uniref:Uncharacterized protein n=1 Tax=Halorubrum alkaliphilum TaxID=261290 RepID=A0A8T4GHF4_9EURY|nr:hypothetical protein [Halorubrum alkaliphilum]MBP1923666.1 hypothetical protein [Halorubrum alkaliphilum]